MIWRSTGSLYNLEETELGDHLRLGGRYAPEATCEVAHPGVENSVGEEIRSSRD